MKLMLLGIKYAAWVVPAVFQEDSIDWVLTCIRCRNISLQIFVIHVRKMQIYQWCYMNFHNVSV